MKCEKRSFPDKKGLCLPTAKLMGLRILFTLSILVFMLVCSAWRPLNSQVPAGLNATRIIAPSVLATPVPQSTLPANEISQQTGESNGIILAGVVIVLIILGGTYGATRRKDQ